MAFLGKVYHVQHEKDENYDMFLKGFGVPEDKIPESLKQPASCKLEKSGDAYTLTHTEGGMERAIPFQSGVEFDYNIDNRQVKTTVTVSGNTVTQTINDDLVCKREFNGDELVVTISSNKHPHVCKRVYKA